MMMTVSHHQNGAPITSQLVSTEQVKALIERVLDCAVIEQDDNGARALITLIYAVAGEENKDTRKMMALDVTAAIYAMTGAFYEAARAFADSVPAQYLAPQATSRTRGKRCLSKGN